jgi:hypothetical protein
MLTFSQLTQIYRAIEFDAKSSEGMLRLNSADIIAALRDALSEENIDRSGIALATGDPDSFKVGQNLRVRCRQPAVFLGVLASTTADLISGSRTREPDNYFVIEEKYAKGDANPPAALKHYFNILRIVGLLKESAAFLDESAQELVFIQNGRFSVPVLYSAEDALAVPPDVADRLSAFFNGDAHQDQKLSILAGTIYDLTSSTPANERFRLILRSIDEITTKLKDGYRLFASGFSYDKVKGEIQDAKLEFTNKIHKTFSDIQNQALAIPVATVIVATQMKSAETFSPEFWVNSGVLFGCYIFVAISLLMLRNQAQTLRTIESEIQRQEAKIAKDHKAIEEMFEKDFGDLHARLKSQHLTLMIVGAIVLFGFIATHVVYAQLWKPRSESSATTPQVGSEPKDMERRNCASVSEKRRDLPPWIHPHWSCVDQHSSRALEKRN